MSLFKLPRELRDHIWSLVLADLPGSRHLLCGHTSLLCGHERLGKGHLIKPELEYNVLLVCRQITAEVLALSPMGQLKNTHNLTVIFESLISLDRFMPYVDFRKVCQVEIGEDNYRDAQEIGARYIDIIAEFLGFCWEVVEEDRAQEKARPSFLIFKVSKPWKDQYGRRYIKEEL